MEVNQNSDQKFSALKLEHIEIKSEIEDELLVGITAQSIAGGQECEDTKGPILGPGIIKTEPTEIKSEPKDEPSFVEFTSQDLIGGGPKIKEESETVSQGPRKEPEIQAVDNEYDGDWTERFIQEIRSRPAIYDNRLPEHSDRHIVTHLWREVCARMVLSWENQSSVEKSRAEKELQGKWRNLRTCFRRELKKQKHGLSGPAARKRRKYVFFDQLLFLLPTLEDRMTISVIDSDEDENSSQTIMDRSNLQDFSDVDAEAHQQPNKQVVPKKKPETCEQSLLNILKEETFDEDKYFLLSLVPMFKKLNDSQKLDAKMEFLATLKRFISVHEKVEA